jgi:CPA2 family monovalent cation:H+ antiporter-2
MDGLGAAAQMLSARVPPFLASGESSPMFGLLTLVLVAVVLVSLILVRIKQSLLVGYFLCGVILANSGALAWMGEESNEVIRSLADLGVILLMFTLGVGFSVAEMKHLRRVALVGGGWQVGLVTLAAAGAALGIGVSAGVALAIGVAVALSSTAVSIKSFQDLGQPDSPGARVALGVAIFQDLLVILFMIVLPPLLGAGEGSMAVGLGLALLKGAAFLAVCLVMSRFGIPQLLLAVARTRSRELFTVTVITLCVGVAYVSGWLGLSPALGAFAAGLVVSESIYSHRVLAEILPFKDLFLTIFFVSVGLLIDVEVVMASWEWVLGGTLAILLVKFGVAFFAARRLGVSLKACLLAAASLASTGEFSLVLLERVAELGALPARAGQVLLASTAIGMGLVPGLMRLMMILAPVMERRGWMSRRHDCMEELTSHGGLGEMKDHVIICGYGPVGRNLSEALAKCGIDYLVVELNADTVRELRGEGVKVLFADARQQEVLEMAGVGRARSIAFTFPDAEAAMAGMRQAREMNPEILVYARAKFSAEAVRLREAGVNQVFHDERESGQAMMKSIVSCYAIEDVFSDEGRW